MKIVLYQPQIPQNTGNIVRTCSVTATSLLLITPLGFSVSSRWLKRAGLDYWEEVEIEIADSLEKELTKCQGTPYFFSSKATQIYTDIKYSEEDWLIFGSETTGLPTDIMEKWNENLATIPMVQNQRCLNLATSVGIALYEAQRQVNFKGMIQPAL